MQTIARLSERLDMSAQEALDTLRRMRFDVADVDTEISDEQCDLLMDVDEDPSTLDDVLQEIAKKEEEKRKKTERLQKANEKRRAQAKKKASVKKKPSAQKKAAAEAADDDAGTEAAPEAEAVPPPEVIPAEEPPAEATVVEATPDEARAPAEPVAEAVEAAPPAETEEAAPAAEAPPESAEAVDAAETEETPEAPAETAPEAESETPEEPPAAPEVRAEIIAEILPPEPETEGEEKPEEPASVVPDDEGALAQAERLQEERAKRKHEKPLPVPDPAVVAEVIRKAQEREREKQDRERGVRAPRPGRAPAAAPAGAGGGSRPFQDKLSNVPMSPEDERTRQFRGPAKKTATGKTARKRARKTERARVLEETLRRDAAAAVRGFQAGGPVSGRKRRKKKRDDGTEYVEERRGGTIEVDESITVEQLAIAMDVEINELILALMDENMMVNKNEVLEMDMIRKVAAKFDFEVRAAIPEEEDLFSDTPDDPESLKLRAPVVTVMGHVDHGKTSLLDVIRKANVVDGEAGGITQHIAAYDVELEQGRITFLDTPGHEAFTQMRARGAEVTDVVVLVVAADDGVKPQTIEAIHHAKAAEVPIVVAVNKCDKPEAQPDRVRQELSQYDLLDEAWGGKTIMKNISCMTGEGIDELMELLVLESEMLELKANPDKSARGAIVESEMARGLGPVAWMLVQAGTLRVGDLFVAGETYGRVRTMTNSQGKQITEAGPSKPVLVTGLSAPATAGDTFVVAEDERRARSVAEKRAAVNRQKRGPAQKRMTLEDFHARMQGVEQKTLSIVVKADVQGSVDVLESSLAKLGNEEVSVQVVHAGVGAINESDVMLASASDAVVVGFHVTADARVQSVAEQEGVDIRTYLVIYELLDEVKKGLEGMLTPDTKEVVTGHAEIRAVFRSSAIGNIAGSFQLDGETTRGSQARLVRDGTIIHDGRIGTLRRERDDVRSVSTGYECGIKLERYDDIQEGDIIECYKVVAVPKTL